jgi:hypothetical protein
MAYYSTGFALTENPINESGAWVPGPGAFENLQTTGGIVQCVVLLNNCSAYLNTPAIGGSQFSQSRVVTSTGTINVGVMVRHSTSSTPSGYILTFYPPTPQVDLQRFLDTTSFTNVGALFSVTAAGRWMRLEAVDDTFACLIDGVLIGTRTDATYATGQPGLMIYASSVNVANAQMDDWSGGDLAAFSPAIVSVGTAAYTASSGGTVTPGMPASVQADDILVIQAETNNNGVWNPATYSGWTIATDGTTTLDANNTANQRFTVFWKRAVGGDTAPGLQLTTNTVTVVRGARMLAIRNCRATGTPFETVAFSANASSTTITYPTLTTLTDHCLILGLGQLIDNPTGMTTPAAWGQPVGSLVSSTLGNAMAFNYVTMFKDQLGATGNFTSTASGAAANVSVGAVMAFVPEPEAAASLVIHAGIARRIGQLY